LGLGINYLGLFVILFFSIVVDFDHYLFYVYYKKDLSLKRALIWYKKKYNQFGKMSKKQKDKYQIGIFIFHGIECFFVMLALKSVFPFMIWVINGWLLHMLLDYIEIIRIKAPLYLKISQIYVIWKNKGKKKL